MGIDYAAIGKAGGLGKGRTRRQIKDRRDRVEDAVLAEVRAEVFVRDVGCRAYFAIGGCLGRLTLAHLRRRSATRGLPPTERHRVDEAVVLCAHHHSKEETHQLRWTYLTEDKANGAMSWDLR